VDPARAAAHMAQAQAVRSNAAIPAAQRAVAAVRGGGAVGRGRGRGRGGRGGAAGGGRVKQPKKSLEDLDAEMEDYATKADS
jgi:THO complex subunit 4